ncbi:ABC transporter permease [Actinokineospora auranticolor]|uniref:ABC-2 type transport system permease protein n=1 Tax=Actinokineospora auranticolor TaxID=155976 RepID=A0A2S6GNC5_9PSEU|nr:ABC transporter permease [Actinokineospora auranticolor]PPK66690.1 ABC-2 type transport system permease protein [Actinokineospora auranticolor]
MNAVLALSRAEVRQLLRNRTTAATALVLPLVMGALFSFTGGHPDWTFVLTAQLVSAQGLTVYISATTACAARRQDLSLKRLRTGELPDLTILLGVLAPFVVLGIVQCLVMSGVAFAAGAPAPANPAAFAIALVGGVAVNAAVGLLTASVTATPEAAQITTAPFFFAALGGGIWVLATDPAKVKEYMLLLPGGAVADLVRGPALGLWLPELSLVVWTAVAWTYGVRKTRWDRRS